MYSRVTLLEIDTVRIDLKEAVARFREEVVPGLKQQDGYEGCVVLTTPEGKAMLITCWETEEAVDAAAGFAAGELERFMLLFSSPPGREHYEVAFLELPEGAVR
jgi:hypothetical protein